MRIDNNYGYEVIKDFVFHDCTKISAGTIFDCNEKVVVHELIEAMRHSLMGEYDAYYKNCEDTVYLKFLPDGKYELSFKNAILRAFDGKGKNIPHGFETPVSLSEDYILENPHLFKLIEIIKQ